MRLRTRLALLLVLPLWATQPAGGQSFLGSLFGPDQPPSRPPASSYGRSQLAPPLFDGLFDPGAGDAPQPHIRASSTYRTLCVRTCDGFYFPISHATSIGNVVQDAEKCTASCSGARLFYQPSSGSDVAGMLDLTGRAYASYPFAYRYRKTLVEGCQCRPQPWSEAELARHRAYAGLHEAPGPPGTQDVVGPVAQDGVDRFAPQRPISYPPFGVPQDNVSFTPQDDLGPLVRPAPIPRQPLAGPWEMYSRQAPDAAGRARSPYGQPGTH